MPSVKTLGAEVHFTVEGTGPSVVLMIPGLGQNSDEWGSRFIDGMAQRHRIVRLDNRGVFPSTISALSMTIPQLASDAAAVLDGVSVDRAHVLGWSMGGRIAQALAVAQPDRIDRLVLLSTYCGSRDWSKMSPRAVPLFQPPAPGTTPSSYFRDAFDRMTAVGFAERHPDLADAFVDQRLRHRVKKEVFFLQAQAASDPYPQEELRRLTCPTLVIHGTEDPLVLVENGRALAALIPGARLVELPGCGHLPPVECPDALLATVSQFLA